MLYRNILIALLTCFSYAPLFADFDEALEMNVPEVRTGLDVHGLVDFSFKNAYITPRGLLVVNTNLTIQIYSALMLDVYKNPCNYFLQKLTVTGGVWNDLWTSQNSPTAGAWNELDWFFGFNFYSMDRWNFGVQFIQLVSPPGNFRPENNVEFLVAYDDSDWGYPVIFNPYVKLFWNVSGDSTVVVGRRGDTYDVEIGMVPTMKLKSCLDEPFILTAPTWFTVGPESFWNGGELGLKYVHCNGGVFSSGLKIEAPLTFISKRLGRWYAALGGQYYYLINRNLLQAQTYTLGIPTRQTHRHIGVASLSIGFGF